MVYSIIVSWQIYPGLVYETIGDGCTAVILSSSFLLYMARELLYMLLIAKLEIAFGGSALTYRKETLWSIRILSISGMFIWAILMLIYTGGEYGKNNKYCFSDIPDLLLVYPFVNDIIHSGLLTSLFGKKVFEVFKKKKKKNLIFLFNFFVYLLD